jgi:hypothetical protein
MISSARLQGFQDRFARALFDTDVIDALTAQPGFAVYRNTVLKACIDALQGNYPVVVQLVGVEWFRAAAVVHVRAQPPASPLLSDYGSGFADFLAGFPPAAAAPYLADVARLDRFWSEAHGARDAAPLAAASLARRAPAELARIRLQPHPSARWRWFAEQPIYSIWHHNRTAADPSAPFIPEWRGEGALIVRPDAVVQWHRLGAAACRFLDACTAGARLSEAAAAALEAQPDADLTRLLAQLLNAGAFAAAGLSIDPEESE